MPRGAIAVGRVALTVVALGAATANGLRYDMPQNATAQVTLTEAPAVDGQRYVTADVRLTPPDGVSDEPNWVRPLYTSPSPRNRPRHAMAARG